MQLLKCDACGADVKRKEASQVTFAVSTEIEAPETKDGPFGRMQRAREHRFELCRECVLGYLVAFKSQKKQIRDTGTIVRQ